MTVPLVSVLLPARDAENTLGLALASILAQAGVELEVLVVDDGSDDGTREVAKRWARNDRRVRVLEGGGRGLVPALETARAVATGSFLARMDADDVALPMRLARQAAYLEAHPETAVCGTGVRYVPDHAVAGGAHRYARWLNSLETPEELHLNRFVECPLAHPTWLLRADAVAEVGGYLDPGWPEDHDLLLRLSEAGWALGRIPEVGLLWREHPDRLSRVDPRYDAEAFRRCRVHHLRQAYPGTEAVVICGAGPTGKAFSRVWREAGGRVRAFADVDPRKIGQEIHGATVVALDELRELRGTLALAAVGSHAGRADIRRVLAEFGWTEGVDFVAVA